MYHTSFKFSIYIALIAPTPKKKGALAKFNIAPEKRWLEGDPFLLGRWLFRGELLNFGGVFWWMVGWWILLLSNWRINLRRVPGNGYVGVSQALAVDGQGGGPSPHGEHVPLKRDPFKWEISWISIINLQKICVRFQGCNKLEWFKFTSFWDVLDF